MHLQQLIHKAMNEPPSLFSSDGSLYENTKIHYQKIRLALKLELDSGCPVGIKLPKEPEYLLCILACMELGLAYVPLKDDFPQNRIDEIKEDSGLRLIIDSEYLSTILHKEFDVSGICNSSAVNLADNTPLYIIFTSGSTGRPKGVVISRGAFVAYSEWLSQFMGEIKPSDRVLQVTEFTFDISLIDLVLYLTKKTPLYFTGFNGAIFKLAQEIATHNITTMSTVPNNVNMLLSDFIATKADFSSLKYLMIGGARFSYGLYQKVCKYFSNKEISNFYGPTEFTIYSHAKKITFNEAVDCQDHNVSIGITNTSVQADIYNAGAFCAPNESGELLLSGKQIMNEYISNSEKTSEAIVVISDVPYYKTGDLAYKNERNEFFVTGRLDDTIKYRGYRINLLDIDSYITKLPYVQDVTTIAVPDEAKENITICFIILNNTNATEISVAQVKLDLKEFLVDYQIPEKIQFIKEFPTNVSGKVCKKQLLQCFLEGKHKQ